MIFKMNWEKTQERVSMPDNVILKMLHMHYAADDIRGFEMISGGCANINIRVYLYGDPECVILRIYVRDGASFSKEREVLKRLRGVIPVSNVIYGGVCESHTFAIMKYIPGTALRDVLLGRRYDDLYNVMFDVGKLLGYISGITFSKCGFFDNDLNVMPHDGKYGIQNYVLSCLGHGNIQKILPPHNIESIKSLFDSHKETLGAMESGEGHLVHGDFDPANILVTKNNGHVQISGILDWEFAFPGSFLWDVSNMLRYAHHMPPDYKSGFLDGVQSSGLILPKNFENIICLLNMVSLLDALQRTKIEDRPNQVQDIHNLLNHFLKCLI